MEDIEKARQAFGIEKRVIFRGTWGSTLVVAYAQCYLERGLYMVLRGMFMLKRQEIEWLGELNGAGVLYLEAFQRYSTGLPQQLR